MVAFNYTQTDVVLGRLTNGRKLVHTTVTVTDNGATITPITIKPLKRVLKWTIGLATPATDTFVCADHATQLNAITITPSGDSTNDVIQIFSVGE